MGFLCTERRKDADIADMTSYRSASTLRTSHICIIMYTVSCSFTQPELWRSNADQQQDIIVRKKSSLARGRRSSCTSLIDAKLTPFL
jgi:hypothetical protein